MPAGVRSTIAIASGMLWFTRMNSRVNCPARTGVAGSTTYSVARSSSAMLAQLDPDQAERQFERVHWRETQLRQHIGQPADVVLVTVGNKDATNAIQLIGR